MTIRPYQPTDEEQVVELWRLCGLVVPPNDPRQEIERKMQVQPELFLVGVVAERIVATAMAGYDGHRGWLYALAVAPDRQRQGLGRRMVEEAEARLEAMGCRKINLQVRAFNAAVIGFWESVCDRPEPTGGSQFAVNSVTEAAGEATIRQANAGPALPTPAS